MNTTNFYHRNKLVRQEKILTLAEFLSLGRVEPGQRLLVGDVTQDGRTCNVHTIWIGHATPYHAPSDNDGGMGWDHSKGLCLSFVIEVHTF